MATNRMELNNENLRINVRNQINEAAEKYAFAGAVGKGEQLENTIHQKSNSVENYYKMVRQLLQRIQMQGATKNAANNMASQDMHNQAQFSQQMQPPQAQPPQFQNQTMPQQAQPMNQMFATQGSNMMNTSMSGMFAPIQPNQPTNVLSQGSPGQAMQLRPNMTPNSSPMSRVHPGNATPSPQTGMTNAYQRSWPHQSPGSQFPIKQFQKRQAPPQSVQQPVLTMPDNTGTPQPSGIPSLSPAHQSPQVQTTSPSLRTPGSIQTVHSPGEYTGVLAVPSPTTSSQPQNQQQEDEKEYMEKLRHLQKYIEPLSRMINKFNEDQGNYSQEMKKMKALRDNLMNPRMRLQLCTLDKCEKVLQNWLGAKPSKQLPRNPDQHMCQPFLNVIAMATNSPVLNHTLKRTFGPAMRTICGEYTTPDYIPNKKQCLQRAVQKIKAKRKKQLVPDVVQGEIARLESKYKVKLDETHKTDDGSVRILCELDDPKLPAVPPLRLEVPSSYPEDCVQWIQEPVYTNQFLDDEDEFKTDDELDDWKPSEGCTGKPLQKLLEPIVSARLKRVGDSNVTISSMITAWETSVREACAVST